MHKNKLVVVGAGHVGSQVITSCNYLNLFSEITIIDKEETVARGEALDHRHALPAFYRGNTSITNGSYEDCADADIIVIAVAVDELLTEDGKMPPRSAWGKQNAKQIREVMAGITRYTNDAIVIIITNPVDSITYIAENEYHYPKGKIFGTGTALDTFRLRKIIADNYKLDSRLVSGFVIGEHGTTAFPLFSTVNIAGIPFNQADEILSVENRLSTDFLTKEVVQTANDVFVWKGWTNTAIAEVTASIVQSIVLDEKMVYPVTASIDGLYGYNGEVAFSTPSVIGSKGLEQQIELPLTEDEIKLLETSVSDITLAIQAYQ